MGSRHPNPRHVKIRRTYSVEEISRPLGVHKRMVRSCLKQGLAALDAQRPTLVRCVVLSRFLRERRLKTKQSCGPGEIYCPPRRAPKVPAGHMAECHPSINRRRFSRSGRLVVAVAGSGADPGAASASSIIVHIAFSLAPARSRRIGDIV